MDSDTDNLVGYMDTGNGVLAHSSQEGWRFPQWKLTDTPTNKEK